MGSVQIYTLTCNREPSRYLPGTTCTPSVFPLASTSTLPIGTFQKFQPAICPTFPHPIPQNASYPSLFGKPISLYPSCGPLSNVHTDEHHICGCHCPMYPSRSSRVPVSRTHLSRALTMVRTLRTATVSSFLILTISTSSATQPKVSMNQRFGSPGPSSMSACPRRKRKVYYHRTTSLLRQWGFGGENLGY